MIASITLLHETLLLHKVVSAHLILASWRRQAPVCIESYSRESINLPMCRETSYSFMRSFKKNKSTLQSCKISSCLSSRKERSRRDSVHIRNKFTKKWRWPVTRKRIKTRETQIFRDKCITLQRILKVSSTSSGGTKHGPNAAKW